MMIEKKKTIDYLLIICQRERPKMRFRRVFSRNWLYVVMGQRTWRYSLLKIGSLIFGWKASRSFDFERKITVDNKSTITIY